MAEPIAVSPYTQIPMTRPADLVQVGRVLGAYGVKGWIRIDPFGGDASVLLGKPAIWFDDSSTSQKISTIKTHGTALVAQLDGVNDRDVAQAMRGNSVWVGRADFPAPEEDEYYWVDLIGCAVVTEDGQALGNITRIEDHGADPVMRIEAGKRVRLVPFASAIVLSVDLNAQQVTVDWDAGWE